MGRGYVQYHRMWPFDLLLLIFFAILADAVDKRWRRESGPSVWYAHELRDLELYELHGDDDYLDSTWAGAQRITTAI